MPRKSRAKGAAGEREAAAHMAELIDEEVRRRPDQYAHGGADLQAALFEHIHVEVKRCERPQIAQWLAKCPSDKTILILWRRDRGDWQHILRLPPMILAAVLKARALDPVDCSLKAEDTCT